MAVGERIEVTFTGAQETLFMPVYCRAEDAKREKPILGDKFVLGLLDRIDYDCAKLGVRPEEVAHILMRARCIDMWTADFLARHAGKPVTVLHLACGLDSRAHRILAARGPGAAHVRWVDVDLPDVVNLRRKVLDTLPTDGASNCEYVLLAGSATDEACVAAVPNDRPTLVIFEGLSMYLKPEEGTALLQTLVARFPAGGEIVFDALSKVVMKVQRWIPFVRKTGATFHWGIDDPARLVELDPRLKLRDNLVGAQMVEMTGVEQRPGVMTALILAVIPAFRNMSRLLRFEF
jgi:O-methyltransferase involved in polyketide biosynthesis